MFKNCSNNFFVIRYLYKNAEINVYELKAFAGVLLVAFGFRLLYICEIGCKMVCLILVPSIRGIYNIGIYT